MVKSKTDQWGSDADVLLRRGVTHKANWDAGGGAYGVSKSAAGQLFLQKFDIIFACKINYLKILRTRRDCLQAWYSNNCSEIPFAVL